MRRYDNILNPVQKYPNGFAHYDNDKNLVPHYDESICLLQKTVGEDTFRIMYGTFSYYLVVNDTCNRITFKDLGNVIHDIVEYKDTESIINKINSYSERLVKEIVEPVDGEVKVIDCDFWTSEIYKDEKEFVKAIKSDISLFHYEYPSHELRDITVFTHNGQCYKMSLLLDDCDVEQHIQYIVYKRDIERIIKELKNVFRVDVRNYTDEPLLKVI